MPEGANIGSLNVRIGADLTEFQQKMRQLDKALAPVRNALSSVGQKMSIGVTAPLVLLGKTAFDSALKMDSLKRGLAAVAGGSAQAEAQLKRLREVAKLPGLGLEEAVQGSINLQAVGFSAGGSERALKAFGNALATVGRGKADLDGVILALSQIASKGKVSAEEINQLAERVPQIRMAMQQAFGTADTEALQKMGIGAEKFIEGIITQLEKLPSVGGSAQNDLENLQDNIKAAMTEIGNAMLPVFKMISEKIVPAIQLATDKFSKLPASVKTTTVVLAGLVAAIGPVALALSAVLTPVGLTIAAIAGLGAVAFIIYDNWKGLPDFMSRVWSSAATIVITAVDKMLMVIEKTTGILFDGPISSAARAARKGLADIQKGLGPTTWDWLTVSFDKAAEQIQAQVGGLMKSVSGLVKPGGAGSGAKERPDLAADLTGMYSKPTRGPLESADYELLPGMTDTTKLIGGELVPAIEAVNEQITTAQVNTVVWGETLRQGLLDGMLQLADSLGNVIGEFVTGFRSIGDLVKGVSDAIRRMMADLVAAMVRMLIIKGLMTILAPYAGGGGLGGFLFQGLSNISGFRASGGPVWPGASFLVGEREPELFTPNIAGRITPISQMLGGGSWQQVETRIEGSNLVVVHRRQLAVESAMGYK